MRSKDYRKKAMDLYKENGRTTIIVTFLLVSIVVAASLFVSIFFVGPALVGLSYFSLESFRKRKSTLEDVIRPGVDNYFKTFLIGIIKPIFIFFWSLLLFIPGIIKSYSYAMAEFIVADNPDLDTFEAITKSRELMDGNKFKLFKLHLSFFGWFLLVIVTLGIASAYVLPYIKLAETAFYLDLINDPALVYGKDEVKVIEDYEVIVE